ncbi:lactose-binding lectin l-2-like [Etheostoma spectabile]|uniref:lactose-binding lectin l-2-like n=1 Tax=Etheostoma spectabile TaxID=54343 RepID=UPI0013AEBAE8|nr:lactose-binding lectin l-2-like [Etheostoma spectabile]
MPFNSADQKLQRLRDSDANMLPFLFLLGLTLGSVSPSDGNPVMLLQGNCPMFWYSFNGRCYKYVATRLTWADAELYCVSQGSNLVSIHSLEEDHFIKALITNFDHAQGFTWIGLSDIHKEGRWMWSDGCIVDFVNWYTGEPNNMAGREHCAHNNYGDWKWNDHQCSSTFPSVCASRNTCP